MLWRYPVLLALLGLLIFGVVMVVGSAFSQSGRRKAMQAALDKARTQRNNIWKEADGIRDMVVLYMTMVAKHGPNSLESKAFRFGTDTRLVKSLHDDEAIQAFEQQADIIDETYRQIKA